ncbi:MAG: hypothetical protein V9G17_11640 [Nitrospira sp.]|nr:hypothetical protein [Nitrospira sp.]HRA96511.1 hypothetical protein [Nitrospira sp.]
MSQPLSVITVIVEVQRLLEMAAYVVVRDPLIAGTNQDKLEFEREQPTEVLSGHWLLAEDAVSIVAIVVYDHLSDLLASWHLAQGAVVDLISRKLSTSDPKLWEGYLVLINPALPTVADKREIEKIRHDVSRVRKIVATGEELLTVSDVERVLLPFLPIDVGTFDVGPASLLEILPGLLATQGVPLDSATVIVDAFKKQEPLLERLFRKKEGQ